jgi:hypothetical protein
VEFASLESAYLGLCKSVLEISFDMLNERRDPSHFSYEVRDVSGRLVLDLPFSEVLRPKRCEALVSDWAAARSMVRKEVERSLDLSATLALELARARAHVIVARDRMAASQALTEALPRPGA